MFFGVKGDVAKFLLQIPQPLVHSHILPALLQKLFGEFFDFCREIWWEIWRKFCGGIFLTNRAQKNRGQFRSIFRKKIRSSTIIFRAKFTLQTCHLNHMCFFPIWARAQGYTNLCEIKTESARSICNVSHLCPSYPQEGSSLAE